MTVVAVSVVRDEADIIRFTVAHLLAVGAERVVVADNRSTDGTRRILDEMAAADSRLTVIDDSDPAHRQGAKMTALAAEMCEPGDWCIPFDADEVWSGLAVLADLDAAEVRARPLVHVPHAADDPADANPCTRIRHRQDSCEPHPKVAFRWQPGIAIDEGNHRIFGSYGPIAETLDVRHFQYRNVAQVARKARRGVAALDAAGMSPTVGAHWRYLAALTDPQLADWWADYTAGALIEDPAPWCR